MIRRRIALLALLPAAVALQVGASLVPGAVETAYSRALYPAVASALVSLTQWLPFSLAEWVEGAFAAWVLASLLRRIVAWVRAALPRRAVALKAAVDGAGVVGAVYLAFLLLWGLNYCREPFGVTAGLDTRPAAAAELADLCRELVGNTNGVRKSVDEDARGVMRLVDSPRQALGRTEAGYRRAAAVHAVLGGRVGRPKPLLLSPLVSYLAITGFYFPFTGEANVVVAVPDSEIPFAACHEMAHALGFAREAEAGYLGYLACRLHPDADFRYSGLLAASEHALAALHAVDGTAWTRLASSRSAAVGRDLAELRAWARRHQGRASAVSETVNSAYLRSQGQAEGVRSYGRMVDLLIAERRAGRPPLAARVTPGLRSGLPRAPGVW